jgi:hypothetical protein
LGIAWDCVGDRKMETRRVEKQKEAKKRRKREGRVGSRCGNMGEEKE